MHWDFVLTSFEPITKVTGGIGTYCRTLIEELLKNQSMKNLNILFLTPHVVDPDWRVGLNADNFRITLVDFSKKYGGGDLNYVGDEHSYFSFKVADYLETLYKAGDTFGLIEFSDYGRDGYFSIKKKRLGVFECGNMVVRLHSPDLMLFHDNMKSLSNLDKLLRYKFEQELYCYKYCDTVLYGGNAMLDRVEDELQKYDISIRNKAIKIQHPFRIISTSKNLPAHSSAFRNKDSLFWQIVADREKIKLCYTGRIERRKGVLDFIETIINNELLTSFILRNNIYLVFCGRDTHTAPDGSSLNQYIDHILLDRSVASNILFSGYVDQETLYKEILPASDAFVFPSLFENYPNALIESLPYGKPTLVSSRGCMPEIGLQFRFVKSYDPSADTAAHEILAFLEDLITHTKQEKSVDAFILQDSPQQVYNTISRSHNDSMAILYKELMKIKPNKHEMNRSNCSVTFVIPHYKNTVFLESCIRSVVKVMRPGDEVFVVDDCSGEKDAALVANICKAYDVQAILLEVNKGPSAARNAGVRQAKCELIQFIDADDILDIDGFNQSRHAMECNCDIDFIYGITHTFGATEHLWMPRDATVDALEENYTHSAILIRREILLQAGLFDESLRLHYEDWELNARLALLGIRGESIPKVTLHYRQKPGSRNISNEHMLEHSRQKVIERSIYNYFKFASKPLASTQLIYNAGVYLQSWVSAASWIGKLNSDVNHLQSQKTEMQSGQLRLGTNFIIGSTRDLDVSGKLRKVDSHIFRRNLSADKNRLIRLINDKVLAMTFRERVESIRDSKLFDADWYLSRYSDVNRVGVDPYVHFEEFGWREKRDPNEFLTMEEIEQVLELNLPKRKTGNKFIVFSLLVE